MHTLLKAKNLPTIMMGLVLGLGLLGCGGTDDIQPKNQTKQTLGSTALFQEGECKGSEVPKPTSTELKINGLHESATNFTYQYNRNHYPYLRAPGEILNLNLVNWNPLHPLILNEELIKKEFESLQTEWRELLGQNNEGFFTSSNLPTEFRPSVVNRVELVDEVHQKINVLRDKIRRFNSQKCNLTQLQERKENDVRKLYHFRKTLGETGQLESEVVLDKLISMCEEFNTRSLCLTELLMSKRKNKLSNVKNHYLKLFKEREDSFYKHSAKLKFSCSEENGVKTLIFPIVDNQELRTRLFGVYEALKSTVEEKWSNENIKVKVEIVGPQDKGIRVEFGDSSLSFVKESDPSYITLSRSLNFSQLVLTFSHEIGHVFGFKDCYHEFYDHSSKSIVYYSLDESGKNLMCNQNFDSTIPDSYLEKMIQGNCK